MKRQSLPHAEEYTGYKHDLVNDIRILYWMVLILLHSSVLV